MRSSSVDPLLIGTLCKSVGFLAPLTHGPIDPRVSPKRAVSSPPAEGASSKPGTTQQQRAEPAGTQDAQPILKFVTPENAAYLCAKTPTPPHLEPSAMEKTR